MTACIRFTTLTMVLAVAGCNRQPPVEENDPIEKAIAENKKRAAPPDLYTGAIPDAGAAQVTMHVRMVCHGGCVYKASQALKSLTWADQDNYRISYDEQKIRVRIPDMKRFDQKQLLEAFAGREVGPAKIIDIKTLPAEASDENEPAPEELRLLAGEWQTDDEAAQKFWLNIRGRRLRLHTTTLEDWSSTTRTILDAGDDWIRYGRSEEDSNELKYQFDGEMLTVSIPAVSLYQGEFKLFRVP